MKNRWLIAVLCFFMIFIGLGFCSSGRSIFLVPVTEALGVSRSAFSVCDSIRYAMAGIISFFMGKLVNRFGTKKLICTGLIALMVATLLYVAASHLAFLYLAGIFFADHRKPSLWLPHCLSYHLRADCDFVGAVFVLL